MAIQQVAVNICIGLIRQINFICEHKINLFYIYIYIKLQEVVPHRMQKVRKKQSWGSKSQKAVLYIICIHNPLNLSIVVDQCGGTT